MKRTLVAGCAVLIALAEPDVARACGCRGVGSPSAAITLSHETWGLSALATSELAHGVWDSDGQYHPLADGELFSRESLGLTLGLRVHADWEISVGTSLVAARASTPNLSDESTGLGDTRLRARWDLLAEPMPHDASPPWPAVALLGTITGGTADAGPDRPAGAGLGAAEAALGVELLRSLPHAWQLEAFVEVAERGADTALGFDRQLGPRALFELGLSHPVVPVLRLGGFTALSLEGETSYEGEAAAGTAQRLWTVSLFAVQELKSINARTSLTFEHAPAIDGIGRNAIGNSALRMALSFSR